METEMPKEIKQEEKVKEEPKKKEVFAAHCYHCKDKDEIESKQGLKFKLPYKTIEIKKDKTLLKECKNILKENKGKYVDDIYLKRRLLNGCPNCGRTIDINCRLYADFYSPVVKAHSKETKK